MASNLQAPCRSKTSNAGLAARSAYTRHRKALTVHAAIKKSSTKNVVCNKTIVAKEKKVCAFRRFRKILLIMKLICGMTDC